MIPPISDFNWNKVSQLFGVNRERYQRDFGLPGHNGIDIVSDYNTPIGAVEDGIIYQIQIDDPIHSKGNGIWIKHQNYYTIYWHLSRFNVVIGQQVKAGDIIGFMGNTGYVFPKPTEENPYAGTHLHFGIWQPEKPLTLNGCIDPTPLFYKSGDHLRINFYRNLFFGKTGDDVAWLQTCLKIEGFAQDYEPTGNYYLKTQRDVGELQKKYNIKPSYGFLGLITRRMLNDKYTGG